MENKILDKEIEKIVVYDAKNKKIKFKEIT